MSGHLAAIITWMLCSQLASTGLEGNIRPHWGEVDLISQCLDSHSEVTIWESSLCFNRPFSRQPFWQVITCKQQRAKNYFLTICFWGNGGDIMTCSPSTWHDLIHKRRGMELSWASDTFRAANVCSSIIYSLFYLLFQLHKFIGRASARIYIKQK